MKNSFQKLKGAVGLFLFSLLTSALIVGCGNSESFVFTGTGLTITSVDVKPATASVAVGATQQYTVEITLSNGSVVDLSQFNGQIAWSSSAPGTATVAQTGLATGVTPGSANITAVVTIPSGETFTDFGVLTVTADEPTLTNIEVTPAEQRLVPGETVTLTVEGFDQNGDPFPLNDSDFTLASSDDNIASFLDLVVTGETVGTATITVTSTIDASIGDTAEITVVEGFLERFESFTVGTPDGQEGWGITNAAYDVAVVDVPSFRTEAEFSIFGNRALRISNAVTSGSFGDWLFGPNVSVPVGETRALPTGTTRNNHFELSFDFGTTMVTEQADLQVSLSPDNGAGGRMSFLRFEDRPDGIAIVFSDYPDGPFVVTDVATGLSRLVPHHVRLAMTVVEGGPQPGDLAPLVNDVVEVYVNDELVYTGTSWEWYYPNGENRQPDITQTVILQARSSAGTAPATSGQGFIFDNFVLSSSNVVL